jgi:hypothetical protein
MIYRSVRYAKDLIPMLDRTPYKFYTGISVKIGQFLCPY